MKLPPPALLTLLLLGSATSAFSDAGVTSRNRCYWVVNRYVAETKGKVCGAFQREFARNRGCQSAESWVELYACGPGPSVRMGDDGTPYKPYRTNPFLFVISTAQARADANTARTYSWGGYGGYQYGFNSCTGAGYICMGTASQRPLFPSKAATLTPTEDNNSFRSASLNTGERDYDPASHTMVINDFRATLRNNPYDRVNEFSALHLSVLRSEDNKTDSLNSNDDNAYRKNLLASSRAMLNNGDLLVDGILQKARIETKDSAGYQIVTITMPRVELQISQDINPDEVTLNMATDVGLLSTGVSPRYVPGDERTVVHVAEPKVADEALEFTSSPNPATAQSAASVEALVSQTQQVSINLYREDNTLALPVYDGELEATERRSFPLDLRTL